MARTRFLELPEELYGAVERAAAERGLTMSEWLAGRLDLTDTPGPVAEGKSEDGAEESAERAAQRELWLMQL